MKATKKSSSLSGLGYATFIPGWRAAGYDIELIFLSLPTVELGIARVAARVAQGGHAIPEDILRRRFDKGLSNFHNIYKGLVTSWILYENAGPAPRRIFSGDNR